MAEKKWFVLQQKDWRWGSFWEVGEGVGVDVDVGATEGFGDWGRGEAPTPLQPLRLDWGERTTPAQPLGVGSIGVSWNLHTHPQLGPSRFSGQIQH